MGASTPKAKCRPLIPELWTQIFGYLVRPASSAGSVSSPYDLCHQQDLTTVMRLNSNLHNIAASLLYTTISVYSTRQLLEGLGFYVLSKSRKIGSNPKMGERYTKAELLGFTKTLHLLYKPKERVGLADLLRFSNWRRISSNCLDDDLLLLKECQLEIADLVVAQEVHYKHVQRKGEVFTRLSSVSIGRIDDGKWWNAELIISKAATERNHLERFYKSEMEQLSAQGVYLLIDIASLPTIRNFCTAVPYGPFSFGPRMIVERESKLRVPQGQIQTFTTHIKRFRTPPLFMPSFNNVVCVDLPDDDIDEEYDDDYSSAKSSGLAKSLGGYYRDITSQHQSQTRKSLWVDYSGTKLSIYGVVPVRNYDHGRLRYNLRRSQFRLPVLSDKELENVSESQMEEMEQTELDHLQEEFVGRVNTRGLKNALQLKRIADTPACEACGYAPEFQCWSKGWDQALETEKTLYKERE